MPNVKPARNGVFISYARSDGEEFANLLRQRLETEQIPLWQDRVGMEGGRDWWLQVTEALDQVEFMALVMTPNALKSDTVRKEWRYARQQGVCVYPIKGSPDLDFESLPRWMRSAHFYDLEREWQKFVNDLKTRCQVRRVPFMVGDLPEGFVQRPDEFDRLLKLLCDEGRDEPIAITAAIRGAGGYGKTTLAKALCHDERIQDLFDDGILWVTLGENPGNLAGLVEDLIVTLGDERPGFTTLDAAVNRFKELLADRDILLVIDDVWDRAHLNPFFQGGRRCARLITTRDLATLPASAGRVRVDAMQQNEAMALLIAGLDEALTNDEGLAKSLKQLATRLGEWPLLLRLVNSALRNRIQNDRQPLRDAIAWVNQALFKRGLTYFDASNSDERHQAVAKTIGVSLDLLSEQDRRRYAELAVFPEDIEIPLGTLKKLWAKTGGFDDWETEELCSRLNRFSLLWSYDANLGRIRLHDVVRTFLIDQQRATLSSIHTQLLDALRPSSASWFELFPEEPYLWEHLAHHLTEAGRGDELVTTVKDWRYLIAKTWIRKSLAVEADLLDAEKVARDDDLLRLLRRNFVNSGHLLNRCNWKEEIALTLFSRLGHLEDLKSMLTDLEQLLKMPFIKPTSSMPDLPHPLLVRTLSGHVAGVSACAVSADGDTIISVSGKTLKVWDAHSGAERFTLNGHIGGLRDCAVSADGETIVSASGDRTLKVWDGRSGVERFTLRGHARLVTGCAVTADGSTIVSSSADKTLKVWDGRSGVERMKLRGHARLVTSCAVSADGKTIVSASDDRTLKVWDGRSGVERFTLRGHTDTVTGCAMTSDGAVIVSASADKTLKVWDGLSGLERFTLSGHENRVRCCTVSADRTTIVSASADKTLKVWNGRSGAERFTLSGHTDQVRGCAVSADGSTIFSASGDKTLKIWDSRSRVEPFKTIGRARLARACAVSADGATIVSSSTGIKLTVWDGPSGAERFRLSGHGDRVFGCAMSADGATIVSASGDRTLKVWDGWSGVNRFTLRGHKGRVRSCAVSADGTTIVSASADDTLRVWNGLNGTERFALHPHKSWAFGCAVSADGETIISVSADKTVKLWDGRSGVERLVLSGHSGVVTSCVASADGTVIVSASTDKTLKIWDGRSGAERFTLSGHTGSVTSCALSTDGSLLISVAQDQALKLWNANTGECHSTLYVDGPLYSCGCSADAEIIAAAGARGIYFLRLVR